MRDTLLATQVLVGRCGNACSARIELGAGLAVG
jgi:hypothetical protein